MPIYLSKKDLLKEIDISKRTYCSFVDPARHATYHGIVRSIEEVTPELISTIITAKAAKKRGETPVILAPEDVVIRVMADFHIPDDPNRARKARSGSRPQITRTNFPPFVHVQLIDGKLVEVGRSHWQGTIEDGEFCLDHGNLSDRLAGMFLLLVERIGMRPNFRGYSYLCDMKGLAVVNLIANGLQFDESKSDNCFAFLTTAVNHCFVRIINQEKKQQTFRDEIRSAAGLSTSASYRYRDQ